MSGFDQAALDAGFREVIAYHKARADASVEPTPQVGPRGHGDGELHHVEVVASAAESGRIAREVLRVNEGALRWLAGEWWVWSGTHWERDEAKLASAILRTCEVSRTPPTDAKPEGGIFPQSRSVQADILQNCQTVMAIAPRIEPWHGTVSKGWLPQDVLATPSGYMHVLSRELIPAEPGLFATSCLQVTPMPMPTPRWDRFVESLDFDADERATLQEVLGYLLSRDTWPQKIVAFQGLKRSGKGTILRLVEHMLGSSAVTTSPGELGGDFGLASLIGRSVALMPDVRDWGGDGAKACAQRLLSLSGEDSLNIQIKHQASQSMRLPCRVLIASNVIPRLSDSAGVLASRFIALRFGVSFFGREDHSLESWLRSEAEGIAWWALDGLVRLREQRHFTDSAAGKEIVHGMARLSSPLESWLEDCCELGPDYTATREELWRSWLGWCEADRTMPGSNRKLFADLDSIGAQRTKSHSGTRGYRGLRIKSVAPASWVD